MPKAIIANGLQKNQVHAASKGKKEVSQAQPPVPPSLPWQHHVLTTSRAVCSTSSCVGLKCLSVLCQVFWRTAPDD